MVVSIMILVNFVAALACAIILSVKRHPIFAVIAWLLVGIYGYGIWHGGLDAEETLVNMMRYSEGYDSDRAYPSILGGYLGLTLTSVAAGLYPWLKKWAVVLWGFFLLAASALVSAYSPLSVVEGLYGICCALMCEFANMTGLTYLETCVVEQLYLHPFIVTLFAVPALVVSIKRFFFGGNKNVVPLILSALMFAINATIMVVTWMHYWGPLIPADQLCCRELQEMASHSWDIYVMLNIMIFVVAFLLDGLICWVIYRYAKAVNSWHLPGACRSSR